MGKAKGGGKGRHQQRQHEPAPSSHEDILAEAEALIERGERQMRFSERKKAYQLFSKAVETVRTAGFGEDPTGSLLVASATGSILTLDTEEEVTRAWAARGAAVATEPMPALGSDQRAAMLRLAHDGLDAGSAAAGGNGMPLDEQSHMCGSRAQLLQLLSEEHEKQAEALLKAGMQEQSRGSMGSAIELAARAVGQWEAAAQLFLAAQTAEEVEADPDVEMLSSLGSGHMHHGRLLLQAVGSVVNGLAVGAVSVDPAQMEAAGAAGQAAVERSLGYFEEACARCDSAKGDDVSEVLKDWAQALWDASSLVPDELKALELSAHKAADAISLQTVPLPAYCNLLGDVLCALGDFAREHPDAEVHVSRANAEGDAVAATRTGAGAAAALVLYKRAVDEGYGRALRVSARDIRAQIGTADAMLSQARIVVQHRGLASATADAAGALDRALQMYAALLQVEPAVWSAQGVPVHERAELLYNAACALAIAGREAECRGLLSLMLQEGDASAAEIEADEDFAAFRACSWWPSLTLG